MIRTEKSSKELDVNRILNIQIDHFMSKNNFWYYFAWMQTLVLLQIWPKIGRTVWPYLSECLTPNVQNNEVQGLRLQRVSQMESESCHLLPEGYKMTMAQFTIFYVVVFSTGLLVLVNVIFWAIYRANWNFFEQFKVEKNQPWPWNIDPVGWRKKVKSASACCLFNNLVMNLIGSCFTQWCYGWQGPWSMATESIPNSLETAKHIAICIICEDFCFHFTHRLFHCKNKYLPLYQWFHKQHHEFMHPVSICSEYCHPIEFLVTNHYPSFVGPLLLGSKVHIWTIMLWGTIRILESHDSHSGYEFPWSIFRIIPFNSDATYHVFHHSANVGNYSSFMTIWDTIFDSNKDFYQAYPEGSRIENEKDHGKKTQTSEKSKNQPKM